MLNMTKKHYEAIARDVKTAYTVANRQQRPAIQKLAVSLCNTFIADNPRFNREMFLLACGVPYTPYDT
jgi:hypothetical protein